MARHFPVAFDEMDTFSEPEPSEGALVQLESGPFAVVVWGKSTGRLTVSLPEKADAGKVIPALLEEARLPAGAITWRADQASPARARVSLARVLRGRPPSRPRPGSQAKAAKKALTKASHRHDPRPKR